MAKRTTKKRTSESLGVLIENGKEKGFLTYDEINDALPQGSFSVEEMDGLLETLRDLGIEVVDSADNAETGSGTAVAKTATVET
ncbi:MAG: RNA polymerase sigma factor region1.1 domain-containing protein, partial [Proteobacteria bacterium]|nr:RNA polymerase sigma factor region1.1 domain-containing protein [Pseudomonadota bacterium]